MSEADPRLLGRNASPYEPNHMFDPRSEDVTPETRSREDATFEPMQIDGDETIARGPLTSDLEARAFGKLHAGGAR